MDECGGQGAGEVDQAVNEHCPKCGAVCRWCRQSTEQCEGCWEYVCGTSLDVQVVQSDQCRAEVAEKEVERLQGIVRALRVALRQGGPGLWCEQSLVDFNTETEQLVNGTVAKAAGGER